MRKDNRSRFSSPVLLSAAATLGLLLAMASIAVDQATSTANAPIAPIAPKNNAESVTETGPVAKVAALQARQDGHRSLRDNPASSQIPPAAPQAFEGYPEAPAFTIIPRRGELTFYPCEDCHGAMPANPQPRELYSPHPATLDHGDGRMWCLDCHEAEDRNTLHTIAKEKVDFNNAQLICGQCHFQQQKDWYFGAHGKRASNWQGERSLYNCTHCHNPHAPAVRPRAPEPPPPIRAGLKPMPDDQHSASVPVEESAHEK